MAAGQTDHAKFRDWFVASWADHNDGLKYSWAGKDGKNTDALLKSHGLDESRRRAGNMWLHSAIKGWPESTDVGCLLSNWNKFGRKPKQKSNSIDTAATAAQHAAEAKERPPF